ncbi:uncharacterized protein K02A2.6-like [Culex pipiens pallens]|uniref:uncharacterized protein K02A2.6-like n=1 Tax=Culex pipiens pallens TaxID=42434 RepID=UPI0022AB228B|nr:uncharacterized protein K02A2.6-like [Culex pipiens pallens]
MSNIPVPEPLKLGGNVEEAVKQFKLQWKYYALATELSKKGNDLQIATFMAVVGAEAVMMIDDLALTEAQQATPTDILQAVEEHLVPARDVRLERADFNTMVQQDGEKIEDFVKRMRKKVKKCGHTPAQQEEMVKDRLIVGISDHQMRKKLLKAGNLTVDQMVVKVKESQDIEDLASKYEKMAAKQSTSRDAGETFKVTATRKLQKPCRYCGNEHDRDKAKCPAYGKTCIGCGGRNHFKNVCWKKGRNQNRNKKHHKKHVRRVEDSSESSASSDTEEECEFVDIAKVDGKNLKEAGKIMVELKVAVGAGKTSPLEIQVDTGARVNVMCYKDLKQLLPDQQLSPTKVKLRCYSGKVIAPKGQVDLEIKLKNGTKLLTFIVVKKTRPPLLSSQSAMDLGIIKVHDLYSIDTLQQECHHILTVQQKPRRIPLAYLPELQSKISDLEKKGIVEPVNKHMDWLCNLVLVKKGTKLRLCLDPAELNQAVRRANHQIPTIEEMLPEFAKAKVFTVLDAKNGFWHMELDEESADLTAFWTPMGVYRWKRMPFGVACASEMYQKEQQQVIVGLRGTRCIADDVVIYGCGDTMEQAMLDHNRNLEAALKRFRERGLKLNRSKAKVALSSVPFFGHVLTDKGVKPDPSKISAVLNIPEPSDKKQLMTFLGLITYLGRFMPRLADVSAPLRKLTRDTVEYVWDQEAAGAFNLIKQLVTQNPILRYYDPTEPLLIQCDASQQGVGCVLLQDERPVAYASRTLTKTERNYASIERECLAIVFACKRHDQYVAGRHQVVVETDHKPLEDIFRKPITEAPLRLQKMRMTLQRYNIHVRYKKGSEMYIADLLSRTATEKPAHNLDAEVMLIEKVDAAFDEIAATNVVELINLSDDRFGEIATETKKDTTLCKLMSVLIDGWPERKEDVSDELLVYRTLQNELTTHRGVIFKGDRVLVPKCLRKKLIEKLHVAHLGIDYTLRAARESFFWPGMADQITNYVRNCEVCMEFSASQCKPPMTSHQIPEYPFQRVNIDLAEIKQEGKRILMMVTADSFSDFVEVDLLADTKTKTIVAACKRNFARHGTPQVVVTDNGPQFSNEAWTKFANEWSFKHVTSAPYHAQGNGKAESAVKSMKQLFKKCAKSGTDFWQALQQHRNTPNAVGTSPNQRIFSRNTRSTIPVITNKLQPPRASHVEDRIEQKRKVVKASYDKHAKELPELKIGENVMVQRRPDLDKQWERATVVHQFPDQSCDVRLEDGGVYRRSAVHIKPGGQQFANQIREPRIMRPPTPTSPVEQHQDEPKQTIFERRDYNKKGGDSGIVDNTPESRERDNETSTTETTNRAEQSRGGQERSKQNEGRPKREIKKPARFSDFVV